MVLRVRLVPVAHDPEAQLHRIHRGAVAGHVQGEDDVVGRVVEVYAAVQGAGPCAAVGEAGPRGGAQPSGGAGGDVPVVEVVVVARAGGTARDLDAISSIGVRDPGVVAIQPGGGGPVGVQLVPGPRLDQEPQVDGGLGAGGGHRHRHAVEHQAAGVLEVDHHVAGALGIDVDALEQRAPGDVEVQARRKVAVLAAASEGVVHRPHAAGGVLHAADLPVVKPVVVVRVEGVARDLDVGAGVRIDRPRVVSVQQGGAPVGVQLVIGPGLDVEKHVDGGLGPGGGHRHRDAVEQDAARIPQVDHHVARVFGIDVDPFEDHGVGDIEDQRLRRVGMSPGADGVVGRAHGLQRSRGPVDRVRHADDVVGGDVIDLSAGPLEVLGPRQRDLGYGHGRKTAAERHGRERCGDAPDFE